MTKTSQLSFSLGFLACYDCSQAREILNHASRIEPTGWLVDFELGRPFPLGALNRLA